jgi:hypothetical protein
MPRYRTPAFRYGQRVQCLARGEVTIVGLSNAPIPWPIGKTLRARSLVLYRGLAHAVRREANQDVARLFGVTGQTVTKWRRALDVPPNNRGTLRRRVEAGKRNRRALVAMHAKARDPVRRAKIAATKRGKPRPRSVIDALRRANLGRKLSAEQRAKTSAAHKRRGTRPPSAGKSWAAWEDRLLDKLPPASVGSKTGRTLTAVYLRRAALGINDGRTTRHKRGGVNL